MSYNGYIAKLKKENNKYDGNKNSEDFWLKMKNSNCQ